MIAICIVPWIDDATEYIEDKPFCFIWKGSGNLNKIKSNSLNTLIENSK